MPATMNQQVITSLTPGILERNDVYIRLSSVISLYQIIPGLRGFWPMAAIGTSNQAQDYSTLGVHLTNVGGIQQIQEGDKLMPLSRFNGSTQYFTTAGDVHDITNDLSFGCWVKFDGIGSTEQLIAKWDGTANDRSYTASKSTGDVISFFTSSTGTNIFSVSSSVTVEAEVWYFVGARYTPSTELAVFVSQNGLLVKDTNTTSIPAALHNSSDSFILGSNNANFPLDGDMRLAWLSTRAVSDSWFNALYEHVRPLI